MNEHQKLVNHTPYLYYFCPISHLSSILEKGILSRNETKQKNLLFEDWSDSAVQEYRSKTKAQLSNGNVDSIHNLVCTFFSPYNTTIYKGQENLASKKLFFHSCVSSIFVKLNLANLKTQQTE